MSSRLGFVRLKCFSVNRTIKFYTTVLCFTLKRKAEIENGSFTYVFLSPRGCAANEEVDLRFECERFKQLKFSKMAKVPISTHSKVRLVMYVKSIREVILAVDRSMTGAWVFSLPQRYSGVIIAVVVDPNGILIQLMEMTSDSALKVPPKYLDYNRNKVAGQKIPVANDATTRKDRSNSNPGKNSANNNEMASSASGYVEKLSFQTSAVRFGYIVIRSTNAIEQAKYYEALFKPTLVDVKTKTAMRVINRKQLKNGLFIVDKEDFPDMLSTYVWLGSGPRSHFTTLCFMHKIERQTVSLPSRAFGGIQLAKREEESNNPIDDLDEDDDEDLHSSGKIQSASQCFQFLMTQKSIQEIDPFLGIGIIVEDIKDTMTRLERHIRYPVTFVRKLEYMEAIGEVCGFVDPEDIQVHLIDIHSTAASNANKDYTAQDKPTRDYNAADQKESLSKFRAMQHRRDHTNIEQTSDESSTLQLSTLPEVEDPAAPASTPGKVFPGRVDRLKHQEE